MDPAIDLTVDHARQLLRHTVATLAYRGGKTLRGAPDSFADFQVREGTRTPAQILAHIGDLMDWACSQAKGAEEWHSSAPLPWPHEVDRFFAAVKAFDDYLASQAPLETLTERLFQGAVADALTHVGQLAMLRRLASSPVKGENYARAEIEAGRVSPERTPPRREFD
jgi:hypothetical protein